MRITPNKIYMAAYPTPFTLRTTAGAVLAAALSTAALAQESSVLPAVTVQSTRASAAMPLHGTVQKERERLAQVPGGTNLAEPQKEARLATLRDALDYQPGIVLQDFFGGTDQPRLGIRGSGIQSNPVNRGVLLLQDGLPLNEADGSFIIGLIEPRNAALVSERRGANATSPGATNKAARTLAVCREKAAQAATRMQPKLCATSTTGPGASMTTSSKRASQSPRRGRIQSFCSTTL